MRLEPHKLAKNNHPLTSHIAAASVKEFANDHFNAILLTLAQIGDGTPEEIADASTQLGIYRMDKHQVVKRMRQLSRQGKVRNQTNDGAEVTRKGVEPYAKPQQVWELVKNG